VNNAKSTPDDLANWSNGRRKNPKRESFLHGNKKLSLPAVPTEADPLEAHSSSQSKPLSRSRTSKSEPLELQLPAEPRRRIRDPLQGELPVEPRRKIRDVEMRKKNRRCLRSSRDLEPDRGALRMSCGSEERLSRNFAQDRSKTGTNLGLKNACDPGWDVEPRLLTKDRRTDMMCWSTERVGLEWLFEHTDSENECGPGKVFQYSICYVSRFSAYKNVCLVFSSTCF